MTDINAPMQKRPTVSDTEAVALVELLFFAYRDFVSDPDEILAQIGFGRAHHRVLHFVGRDPGMTVTELLEILGITKQSLSRVLKDLIEKDYIYQKEGSEDRRQRLLFLTASGEALWKRLVEPQMKRFRRALMETNSKPGGHYHDLLYHLISAPNRDFVRNWIERVSVVGEGEN